MISASAATSRPRSIRTALPLLLAALLALAFPDAAHAQYMAPAGNEPPREPIAPPGVPTDNPFGEPQRASDPSRLQGEEGVRAKHAFAQELERSRALEPLRTLAVLHNGRVKILDTLARETVQKIAGRRDYFDVIVQEGQGRKRVVQKLEYDPLFTMLDIMIDPGYYGDKPLVHVEYLPLRERYLERAYPGDEATQRKYKMITRLPVMVAARYFEPIRDAYDMQEQYRQGLGRVGQALMLFREAPQTLLLVAAADPDQPYTHVSTLPADHPVRQALAGIGAAWRARDAQAVATAAATVAQILPTINAQSYPTGRRQLELVYNTTHAFEWGYWAYLVSLVSLILAFGTGRRWLIGLGVATLAIAIGLHAFGFISRCIIAERFAIQNQFESMTGVSLFGAVVGLGIMAVRRQWLFGAAAAGVGFLVLITATQTAIPGKIIEREAAILNTSVLLKYHVTTVLASYGLITLGMIVSLFYLGTHYAAKARGKLPDPAATATTIASAPGGPSLAVTALGVEEGQPVGVRRTLSDLDKAQMVVLQLAFWTLGVGILLGAWWADHSWGRWWAFDPKETWALITWIVYLIAIHTRFTGVKNKGLVTAWLSVIGFVVMLWCYFGVNLLLPGLHAYA